MLGETLKLLIVQPAPVDRLSSYGKRLARGKSGRTDRKSHACVVEQLKRAQERLECGRWREKRDFYGNCQPRRNFTRTTLSPHAGERSARVSVLQKILDL
ncbi:hypothetical protein JZ751_018979 [Albula glossodonta]|uniref:Uncharacterized protein n=1 Tax=Albula glossodonta TaxID=121402 RepID=A0A8T2NN54_9TELE|nr:hypothetical protein JZ751_018979 [Albula glossodonta]